MSDVDTAMWTSQDDRCVGQLLAAIEADDLLSALLAIEGVGDAEALATRAAVRGWADDVNDVLASTTGSPRAALTCLRDVLAQGAGLSGDTCDYYAPRNSAISEVVRRRRGQPILLASVWLVVGRLAELDVVGVGLPGHFIVRIGGEDGILADPFNGGRELREADCADLVRELSGGALPWESSYLAAKTTGAISERVLRNLINASQRGHDRRTQYRAVRLLSEVRAGDRGAALLHARLAEELGAVCLAHQIYARICVEFAGTCEAVIAKRRLAIVEDAERELH